MAIIDHPAYGTYEVETIVVDDTTSFTLACSPRRNTLPGNGGIRWLSYDSRAAQEEEAIMLAHAMDRKHGLYQTGFSGGKIVVNSKAKPENAMHVFDAIAQLLNRYNGSMYTGCDINTSSTHMQYLRLSSPWILDALESPQINTSIATGYGVWSALQTVIEHAPGTGARPQIAIHGMGKVGCEIARQCLKHGYDVVGFDVRPTPAIPAEVRMLDKEAFWAFPSDILCIASLSGILDASTVEKVAARWVISSSNSPFSSPETQNRLLERGINYLPDYVSNAGAVLCDSIEKMYPDRYRNMSQDQANEYVAALISNRTRELIGRSQVLGFDVHMLLTA